MRFTTLSLTTALLAISTMAAPADHFLSVRDDPCQADSKAHCCDTVANTTDTSIAGTLAKLNITPGQAKGPVGLTCTPITTLGEILNLGTRCNSNAVCCSNNTYTGLINFGCTPMNINIL